MTGRLHFHFSLSYIGEGNGNPLQCSCLENPRDGGAWWAAVYGVAQSQTRLKRLSSSSSSLIFIWKGKGARRTEIIFINNKIEAISLHSFKTYCIDIVMKAAWYLWRDCGWCSFAQSCPTLCDPMDCSTPGFPPLLYPGVCSNSCPLNQWQTDFSQGSKATWWIR